MSAGTDIPAAASAPISNDQSVLVYRYGRIEYISQQTMQEDMRRDRRALDLQIARSPEAWI